MIVLLTNFDAAEVQTWLPHLERHLPDERIHVHPEIPDLEQIDVALVANPPPGVLATFPNLKLIQSLWAGVDSLLRDSSLPSNVPLARLVDLALTQSMVESVLTHVLVLHRQIPAYRSQQQTRTWKPLEQPNASERTVGVLGLGQLGRACTTHLKHIGFRVIGWSSRPIALEHVTTFHGGDGLHTVLEQSEVLVNLLPLTDDTRGILNASAFAQMPQGSSLVNVARGAHVIGTDLIAALDSGHLKHAILDVFEQEPLPMDHSFWHHPNITVLPHVAASTNPATASNVVAQNIRRLRAGQPLEHLVDRLRGY